MADPGRFGYKRLEVYRLAHDLAIRIDAMTCRLPCNRRFEEGEQVRKSSKSASAQIVEGYALRKYKAEFLHYLHRAPASTNETHEHLDLLHETGQLKSATEYSALVSDVQKLSAKLGRFIRGVEGHHSMPFYLR